MTESEFLKFKLLRCLLKRSIIYCVHKLFLTLNMKIAISWSLIQQCWQSSGCSQHFFSLLEAVSRQIALSAYSSFGMFLFWVIKRESRTSALHISSISIFQRGNIIFYLCSISILLEFVPNE